MTTPASSGRRSPLLHFLLVAAFLLIATPIFPLFFLGTLALLLVVSHPGTTREWLWIAVSVGAVIAWFQLPDSLSQQTVRASAIFFIGAFVALTLAGMRSLSARALLAVTLAALATVAWFAAYHLRFVDLQQDFVTTTWAASRIRWETLPLTPPPATIDALASPGSDRAHALSAMLSTLAVFYAALIAMAALMGSWLAWFWYQRIARTPIGTPSKPFVEFRFNDHLVWALVVAIALLLVPQAASWHVTAENLLLVLLSLYWLRGLAVMATALRRASPLVIGVLILIMLPMIAFVLVGFTLLGVADTWLDFRRRMAPPTGVPT